MITADIRQHYRPVQPTVKNDASVVYLEHLPDISLRPYIYCYWELKTVKPLNEQFSYSVVADGCIDIFFDLNNPEESFVMGFCKKYTEFPMENVFHFVGIRFFPSMFTQLFKVSAADLSNRVEELHRVAPSSYKFIAENFNRTQRAEAITALLDKYFNEHITKIETDIDPRFYNALALILKNRGVIDIETDLNTGISPRQLRRLFEYYVGCSSKAFSKVVRFQSILNAKPSTESLKKNKLFFDSGYYDQSHFIKEFKNFYGVTPSQAFRR
jgi:AraC-like DNA-binding protein